MLVTEDKREMESLMRLETLWDFARRRLCETWWDQWDLMRLVILKENNVFFLKFLFVLTLSLQWSLIYISLRLPASLTINPPPSLFDLLSVSVTNSAAFLQRHGHESFGSPSPTPAATSFSQWLSSDLINPVTKLLLSRLLCHWQRCFCLSDFFLQVFATSLVTPAAGPLQPELTFTPLTVLEPQNVHSLYQ